jgi:hypothetical protein
MTTNYDIKIDNKRRLVVNNKIFNTSVGMDFAYDSGYIYLLTFDNLIKYLIKHNDNEIELEIIEIIDIVNFKKIKIQDEIIIISNISNEIKFNKNLLFISCSMI